MAKPTTAANATALLRETLEERTDRFVESVIRSEASDPQRGTARCPSPNARPVFWSQCQGAFKFVLCQTSALTKRSNLNRREQVACCRRAPARARLGSATAGACSTAPHTQAQTMKVVLIGKVCTVIRDDARRSAEISSRPSRLFPEGHFIAPLMNPPVERQDRRVVVPVKAQRNLDVQSQVHSTRTCMTTTVRSGKRDDPEQPSVRIQCPCSQSCRRHRRRRSQCLMLEGGSP